MRKLIVGTRKSKLAVTQTKWVIDKLQREGIKNEFEIKYISTLGDRKQHVSLAKVGGANIFIHDIEEELAKKEIDFAVHSFKDLPMNIEDLFTIAAIPRREDHRDAFIGRNHIKLDQLPSGAVIGTSSARRAAQMKAILPHIETKWIRGAVDGRLKQLAEGKYDGIILAVAGLKRLGMSSVITEYLPVENFVPATGQGALALECRSDDIEIQQILSKINDVDTETAVLTEKAFVKQLDEEDKAPIGAYAHIENGTIVLYASVVSIDGSKVLTSKTIGTTPLEVANRAANTLTDKGANKLIECAKMELDKE